MTFEITTILAKVAPTLLAQAIKMGVHSALNSTPISKAIEATHSEWADTEIEGVRDALSKWCQSHQFTELLEEIKKEGSNLDDGKLVSSFLKVSGFYCADGTTIVARQIIETFCQKLEEELFVSHEGISILA